MAHQDHIQLTLKSIETLLGEGRSEQALSLLETSTLPPALYLATRGTIAQKLEQHQEAEVYHLKALELDPNSVLSNGNLASMLMAQKKHKRALPYAERAYKALPTNENFALTYAACLADSDRNKEAVEVLRKLCDKQKPKVSHLVSYASLLRADLRPEEALLVLERAQSLYPNDPEAERGLAEVFGETNQHEASKAFDKARARQPESLPLRWNSSFVELRLGNFEKGWDLYEAGLSDKIGRIGRPLPAQVKQFKLVTQLRDLDPSKWTIFTSEQGIGDQVLFLGCLREALQTYPKAILISEDRTLPVYARSFPEIGVYTYGFAASIAGQVDRINGVFPVGSLMKHFRADAAAFSKHRTPYLVPNPERVAKLREKVAGHIKGQKIIGISWKGGFWDRQKRTKSLDFALFGKMAMERGVRLVCLQYGDVKEEQTLAREQGWPVTFINGIDFKKDIDGWFALACACDRIVSVSTALVHFAGAAGMKVDLLLGEFQAPFIWGMEEGASLPYPEVKIHRINKEQGPAEMFQRIGATL